MISTVHKAKGREWRNVRISEDFTKSVKSVSGGANTLDISRSEARIFYVAITRAKECLDVDPKLLATFR
ncbi:MAG: hypothetical protein QOH65_1074 [Methylobacteriaceae bacterium]|nr:hypothetical protein [Methylobacteriaceae bacterium]